METVKTSDYIHVNTCKESLYNDEVYNNFKRDSNFNIILEHTSESWANIYIGLLFDNYENYLKILDWEKLKDNDKIGNANVLNFPALKSVSQYPDYSPSTINYIHRGLDIIDKFLKDKKDINILEIGGGYGGQCKILLDMCDMLNIKINSYGIIDLEYVSKLQKKYLSTFEYSNIQYYEFENIDNFDVFKKYDTVISIYALGEFDIDVQNYYVDNILGNKDCYLIWNTEQINKYFKNDFIVDEIPKTGIFNKLIIKKINMK